MMVRFMVVSIDDFYRDNLLDLISGFGLLSLGPRDVAFLLLPREGFTVINQTSRVGKACAGHAYGLRSEWAC